MIKVGGGLEGRKEGTVMRRERDGKRGVGEVAEVEVGIELTVDRRGT